VTSALTAVAAAIPPDWRRGLVERLDLPRFLFAPDDLIVVVGQDGLVANVAKYLADQVVIGIDPEPGRNPGVLVPYQPKAAAGLLAAVAGSAPGIETLSMVSSLALPAPTEARLAWFVREAWPSPATGTAFTEGSLAGGEVLAVTAESDQLVLFGDGVESDTVPLTWGQTARLRISSRSLRRLR
jgi:hypothetical protein